MKICILIPAIKKGGAERMAVSLANELYSKQNEVTVLSFDKNLPSYNIEPGITFINLYVDGKSKIFGLLNRTRILRREVKRINPEVLLCFFMKTVIYAIFSVKNLTKIVGAERTNPYYHKKNLLYRLAEKYILPLADGYIFLTKEAQDYYSSKIKSKSTVIPNGIFENQLPNKKIEFEDRNFNKITAVGRLSEVKDYITMLEAFKIFSDTNKSHELYIYGEGIELEKLIKKREELNLEGKVFFMGLTENVADNIADSGMYLLTSKSESWCNSLLEALAAGIPSISTDCDFGPRNMITNRHNGLLVAVEDPTALATAMSEVAHNKEFAKLLSLNAMKVRETYKASGIAEQYRDYLEKVKYSKG